MIKPGQVMALAVLVLAACSTSVPSPSPSPSPVGVLYVENRGGPALVIRLNGVDAVTVPCDGSPTMSPGQNGLPSLPWAVSVTRKNDGIAVWSGQITNLPAWYVQIGDTVLGLGFSQVIGPPGPTCAPSE